MILNARILRIQYLNSNSRWSIEIWLRNRMNAIKNVWLKIFRFVGLKANWARGSAVNLRGTAPIITKNSISVQVVLISNLSGITLVLSRRTYVRTMSVKWKATWLQ
jgi:hypothetical protein